MLKLGPGILLSVLVVLASSTASGIHINGSPVLPRGGTLPSGGKIWALLVAGSRGYGNYRHQADVCHAYQILRQNRIPAENIVVMMYDDVARSPENPTPNVIINRPNGTNVYKGVAIDYSGQDVNSTNFLNVLTGQSNAVKGIGSGRVINSGPDDYIFINFVDHGAPGYLCFPDDQLHARTLERALLSMYGQKRFSKMVLYVEACESGSMFDDILPDNSNIFVMTAADPQESSYACYYDQLRETYLGDVFSVAWMEDSDWENLSTESLHHQFEVVRHDTNTSHVEEYGDLNIGALPVAYFQGYKSHVSSSDQATKTKKLPPIQDAVSSRDVPLEILKRRYEAAADRKTKRSLKFKIHRLQKLRTHLNGVVSDIASLIANEDEAKTRYLLESHNRLTASKLDCYETLVKYFNLKCFKLSENPHALSQMKVFINVCSASWVTTKSPFKAMDAICVPERAFTGVV